MTTVSIHDQMQSLKNGHLIIIYDDLNKKTGYFMGLAEKATPKTVNDMIKIGKGLTYVSMPESKAKQLRLPFMVKEKDSPNDQIFTVSIDYKTTTTGISAFERAQTIKALAQKEISPEDFHRPGHVFPLVGNDLGLLQKVDVVEASIDLATFCSSTPIAYMSEILNDAGEMATEAEINEIARKHGYRIINISDILKTTSDHVIHSFSAKVIKGKRIGSLIGFPTANLDVSESNLQLSRGAYGVKAQYENTEYLGLMSVGVRPTFHREETTYQYEVHLFDFDKEIYGEELKVDVCFYIREETAFSSVDQLVQQIERDKTYALRRFHLTETRRLHHG